jgi:hypothetical protein
MLGLKHKKSGHLIILQKSRGYIFARLDNLDQNWTPEMENEALSVCRRMDEFARLIPYLPKRTALQIWGVPFAKAWLVLSPIVKKERIKTDWSQKWCAFEELGSSALRRHPEVNKKINNNVTTTVISNTNK